MPVSRRTFIEQGVQTILLIGAGNAVTAFSSDDYKHRSPEDVALRFAIASDGHYGQSGTEYTAWHQEMIEWINNEHEDDPLQFAFINGDLFHDDAAYLPAVKKLYGELKMEWHVSHGNHDKTSEANWQSFFGQPWDYTFEHGDCGFIVLNTASDAGAYSCPNPAVAAAALQKFAGKKHVFVFMHITPFKWTNGGIDCPEITTLFAQQNNLRAVFHGHDHDMDGMKEAGGKHYFFDAHIAGNWGTAYRGYRVVEVLHNGDILTYQVNPSRPEKVNSHTVKS